MTVSKYFTKIKILWEELGEFRSIHTCTCGGLQPLVDHLHTEYVLIFVTVLNETFDQIRGQILLMDPIPSVNRVFSLVFQEEKQKEADSGSGPIENQLAYAIHLSHNMPRKTGHCVLTVDLLVIQKKNV